MHIPSGGNPLPARCSCASPVSGQEFAKFGLILGPGFLGPGLLSPGLLGPGLGPLWLLSPGLLSPGFLRPGLLLRHKVPGHRRLRLLRRAIRGNAAPAAAAIAARVATGAAPPVVETVQAAVDAVVAVPSRRTLK